MDRIVRKLGVPALFAAFIGVLTMAWAHSNVPVTAGAIGSSPAINATPRAHTPANAVRAESGVSIQPEWVSSGQNNHNTRSAAEEHTINAGNVGNLKTAWTFTTAGDVSATAIVVNGVAYFPDWGGKLWAINTKTGKAIWSHDVSDYTGTAGSASRTSPAYWNGELVIGTGNLMTAGLGPAFEIGINARTGAMLWRTKTDAEPGHNRDWISNHRRWRHLYRGVLQDRAHDDYANIPRLRGGARRAHWQDPMEDLYGARWF